MNLSRVLSVYFCMLPIVPHGMFLPMRILFAMPACAALLAVAAAARGVFASQLVIDAEGNHDSCEGDDAIYYDVLGVHILR